MKTSPLPPFLRKPQFWLAAALVIVALAARLLPGPRTIDDAFITFRYARNLLAGSGFTFNPGEAVLGTTTPLYTLLMAGLGALTGGTHAPFPVLAMDKGAPNRNKPQDGDSRSMLDRIADRFSWKKG